MEKEVVAIPGVSDAPNRYDAPLSPVVRAGDWLFTSGMPPKDYETGYMIDGDIETQTRKVLDNLKMVLEASGSSLDRVVKTTVFAANAAYFGLINEIYKEYFPAQFPARTFVTVGSWPARFDVEIECVAIVG